MGDRDKGGSPCLEILTVAMVTRHNRQQRRRGLHYLRGNSRGRRRKVFGVASPQRAQLPQDRGKECEGVTQVDALVGKRENGGDNAAERAEMLEKV